MGNYASGKDAYGISDRSGFRYRLRDMRVEWNGLKVGSDEFEAKHPQLDPRRRVVDPQALRDPRPDTGKGHVFVPVGNNVFPPVDKAQMTGSVGSVTVVV
jgi:hypothetical protein